MKPQDIKLNPDNPRVIKDDKFQNLVKSLKEFPEMATVRPVVIDENNVILGGNMRYKAMLEAKWTDIPVTQVKGWTEDQKREFIIKDNVSGGEWDWDILANSWDVQKLDDWGVDLPKDLQHTEVEEDEAPEVSSESPVSKLGEVYQLGRHRLMCGDSTKIEDVEKLMDGKRADMVFTSPPYNANAKTGDGDIFNKKGSKKMYEGEYVDNMESDDYLKLAKSVLEVCFTNTDGFIFWNVSYNANSRFQYIKQIEGKLEYLIEQIVWKKSSAIPIKGSMRRAWEPIYVFSTNKQTLGTDEVETNIWEVSNANSQTDTHKACFPVGLPMRGIRIVKNSKIVLDPFLGSGSTLIACEQTNRTCYGMELDPKYTDVIRKRYAKFIGKEEEWQEATPSIKNGE